MQEFDILFYKGKSIISKTIQRFTKSPYSHVALVITPDLIVETDWYYPVRYRENVYVHEEFTIKRYEHLTDEQKEKILEYINEHLDTRYDYIQIIYHVLNILFGWKVRNDPNTFTCSELIDRAFMYAGIDLDPSREDGSLTPAELFNSPYLVEVKM